MLHYVLAILSSYLSSRQLVHNTGSGPSVKHITLGAAQGFILGPDLWSVNYNGILRADMPKITFLVGYEVREGTRDVKKVFNGLRWGNILIVLEYNLKQLLYSTS